MTQQLALIDSATNGILTSMTAEEARRLTEEIKSNLQALWFKIKEIHDREGWRALGYGSFTQYCEKEFAWSRRRAYQLMEAAEIATGLHKNCELSFTIPEYKARELARLKQPEPDPEDGRKKIIDFEIVKDVVESTDLPNTSVRQLKKIVDARLKVIKREEAARKKEWEIAQPVPIQQVFDYEPETGNVWYFNQCDKRFGFDYPGRIPGQILVNFLHLYTQKGDIVVDPFAGSGTTIDVCKYMERRYLAYDIAPARSDIEQNDVTNGLPVSDNVAHAIFLDPPYWKQKQGEYTDLPTDLSNMDDEYFFVVIYALAEECKRIMMTGGTVGIIISQLRGNGKVYDLALKCYEQFTNAGFELIERIIVPYEHATSDTGFWRLQAKRGRFLLREFRDLMIFCPIDR